MSTSEHAYVLFDETIRDGLQAPGIPVPSTTIKARLIELMVSAGIGAVNVGFPGASPAAARSCIELVQCIEQRRLHIQPACCGRTHDDDIAAIRDVAETAQTSIEAYAFVAVSPVRHIVENWTVESIERRIRNSAAACRRSGIDFVLVLEDATRSERNILSRVFSTAASQGIGRVVLCDTVGCADPDSTRKLVDWTSDHFAAAGWPVKIDWHGHNDRGLALINSLTALEAGCDRIHGTVLGIGERAGNAAIDQIILNRHLGNNDTFDLKALRRYSEYAANVLDLDIPSNYPGLGSDVFKTSAGVHAAAILKARHSGGVELMDRVYSSVPASDLGRCQEVVIDSSSGGSNVEFWLLEHGHTPTAECVARILNAAKSSAGPLMSEQICALLEPV
jgi:2-isopropylmalate synthase